MKNISFDFGLFFIYHLAMAALFVGRFIKSAKKEALFAIFLGAVLVAPSVVHKVRSRWKWPGLDKFSLPSALLSVVSVYVFFVVTAYIFTGHKSPDFYTVKLLDLIKDSWFVVLKAASIPWMTPWYLAGVGIGVFNLLSSLKVVTSKKLVFESQCVRG